MIIIVIVLIIVIVFVGVYLYLNNCDKSTKQSVENFDFYKISYTDFSNLFRYSIDFVMLHFSYFDLNFDLDVYHQLRMVYNEYV